MPYDTTRIRSVVAADETEAVYYTLDGIRVNKQNLVPGIYVVVKNGKAVKVTVK